MDAILRRHLEISKWNFPWSMLPVGPRWAPCWSHEPYYQRRSRKRSPHFADIREWSTSILMSVWPFHCFLNCSLAMGRRHLLTNWAERRYDEKACLLDTEFVYPDSKVHGDNMWPIWGRQDPGGPHVGPMNFAIWVDWQNVSVYTLDRPVYIYLWFVLYTYNNRSNSITYI